MTQNTSTPVSSLTATTSAPALPLFTLRTWLYEWRNCEHCQCYVGALLGLWHYDGNCGEIPAQLHRLFLTDNPVMDALLDMLMSLEEVGVLESRWQPQLEFRWNPTFVLAEPVDTRAKTNKPASGNTNTNKSSKRSKELKDWRITQ